MHEHDTKATDNELTSDIEQLVVAPPLKALISADFDYAAFIDAINNDPKLNDEQKERIAEHFHPETKIPFVASNPGPTITTYIEMGAFSTPPVDPLQSSEDRLNSPETPLAADHDVSKMWAEVWQQTLQHYAAEATEYDALMTQKGRPILDDPMGYPAKAPPISLIHETDSINAEVNIGKDDHVVALVTEAFLAKLEPEDQRAILFHEAQHAFEPVLSKKTPKQFFKHDARLSFLTGNYYSRNLERRADSHAGKMGVGSELQIAINKIEDAYIPEMEHRETVFGHLVNNGFSVDKQLLSEILEVVEAEIYPDSETPSSRLGSVLNTLAERKNDHQINKHVNEVNKDLQKGAGNEASQPKIKQFASHVRDTISDRMHTHPETPSRIDALGKAKPCNGCADPSPFTSHGDRVKAISESGIQGIVR